MAGTIVEHAEHAFGDVRLFESEKVIELYAVTLEELGFKSTNGLDWAPGWESICVAAYSHGLYECPDEVALQLCLHYGTLPLGKHLKVFSRIKLSVVDDTYPVMFDLIRRDGQCELGLVTSTKNYITTDLFIFCLNKL